MAEQKGGLLKGMRAAGGDSEMAKLWDKIQSEGLPARQVIARGLLPGTDDGKRSTPAKGIPEKAIVKTGQRAKPGHYDN